MRQFLYTSLSTSGCLQVDLDGILLESRHNNALDGLTGLLWVDGDRFLQVLEGSDEAVAAAVERIRGDSRHRDIEVLVDRPTDTREFGAWSMALRYRGESIDDLDERVRALVARTSAAVGGQFDLLLGSHPGAGAGLGAAGRC